MLQDVLRFEVIISNIAMIITGGVIILVMKLATRAANVIIVPIVTSVTFEIVSMEFRCSRRISQQEQKPISKPCFGKLIALRIQSAGAHRTKTQMQRFPGVDTDFADDCFVRIEIGK